MEWVQSTSHPRAASRAVCSVLRRESGYRNTERHVPGYTTTKEASQAYDCDYDRDCNDDEGGPSHPCRSSLGGGMEGS